MRTALFSEREREILTEFIRTGIEPDTQFFRTLKSRIRTNEVIGEDFKIMKEVKSIISKLI